MITVTRVLLTHGWHSNNKNVVIKLLDHVENGVY